MSGYSYGGNPPQYPPPQNQIYPQIYNPANTQPGQPPAQGFPAPGQNQQYPYQPGYAYPYAGQPGQTGPPGQPGVPPSAMSYPTAPPQAYPGFANVTPHPGYPNMTPQPGYPNVTPQQGYPNVTPHPGGQPVEWIRATPNDAPSLSNRAVVAGYEGHDGSPLWIIRANFEGDLIPGKLAIKHRTAFVPWGGVENMVQNFEVCCAQPDKVVWRESRNGQVPPNAIAAGRTSNGEVLYVGRAKEQGSLTPGKIHPSHECMYICFAGKELPHKIYEVLCVV